MFQIIRNIIHSSGQFTLLGKLSPLWTSYEIHVYKLVFDYHMRHVKSSHDFHVNSVTNLICSILAKTT